MAGEINFLENEIFKQIARDMGISDEIEVSFSLESKFKESVWNDPEIQEVVIFANDENLVWTQEGIYYDGEKIILYIRDVAQYSNYEPTEPKFHLAWCNTLKFMHKQGRYEKYVVSRDTSGIFTVNYISGNKIIRTDKKNLHVCKHCLKMLNWENYKNVSDRIKNDIYENFSVEDFFESAGANERNFAYMPSYSEDTAPPNIYPRNWKIISKIIRTEAGYICSECHKKVEPRNLHVHHKNGIKNDCSRSNLEVLCADCHQKRHNHKIIGSTKFDNIKLFM